MQKDQEFYPGEDFSNLLSGSADLFLKYLFDKYYTGLCKLAFTYAGRTDIAEDIVQDVFINIWKKRFQLNYTGPIKPCLTTSVINASLNYIRSRFARLDMRTEEEALNNPLQSDQHQEMLGRELDRLVKTGIEQLPERCRIIFTLSRFAGLSHKEIAAKLNISVKTVEAQITIAVKKLSSFLSRFGYLSIGLAFLLPG